MKVKKTKHRTPGKTLCDDGPDLSWMMPPMPVNSIAGGTSPFLFLYYTEASLPRCGIRGRGKEALFVSRARNAPQTIFLRLDPQNPPLGSVQPRGKQTNPRSLHSASRSQIQRKAKGVNNNAKQIEKPVHRSIKPGGRRVHHCRSSASSMHQSIREKETIKVLSSSA